MILGLITFFFGFICFLLLVLILIQKGANSTGMGAMGGSQLMLFGGSGGQNIFQKITWGLGAFFMIGSLVLSIVKTNQVRGSRYLDRIPTTMPIQQQPTQPQQSIPEVPAQAPTQEPT